MIVLLSHPIDLAHYIMHLAACPLNGGTSVTFAMPALDVSVHLIIPTLLLLCVVAELTYVKLRLSVINELKTTGLAWSVLIIALLPEMAPTPVTACPPSLFKITHSDSATLKW
jgi:hypothetical protein